ncbi:serine recombinase [Williamsia phyllosphaerae]|nr:serine recombinase [Williamsia phyllosphaerae]
MSAGADRAWNARDAILLWLYEMKMQGNGSPVVDVGDVQAAANWAAEPITADEVASATNYLKDQGYIKGSGAFGGGVPRPAITSDGENLVAQGLSVRPGPAQQANTTGVTNTYNVTTNAPTNVAIGSNNFTQTFAPTGEQVESLLAVANALERLLASQEPVDAGRVEALADDVRAAAAEPEQDKNKLMAILSNVIGAVSTAAGSEMGQQVTNLAVGVIQSLG